MQLVLIRHGIAEDARDGDDAARELTEEGRRKMRQGAAGLREIVETLDVIAASPLVRAQQTAEIVAKDYGKLPIVTVKGLMPESPPTELMYWLEEQDADVIAVVGHEPHLGKAVTWFTTGVENSHVEMTKGGAAMLEFHSRVGAGDASLRWLLTGSQLRSLGK